MLLFDDAGQKGLSHRTQPLQPWGFGLTILFQKQCSVLHHLGFWSHLLLWGSWCRPLGTRAAL